MLLLILQNILNYFYPFSALTRVRKKRNLTVPTPKLHRANVIGKIPNMVMKIYEKKKSFFFNFSSLKTPGLLLEK